MNQYNYRIYPILFIAFLKVAVSFTLELAIPIYFVQEGYDPALIGVIISGSAMTYLFSPLLLRNVPLKIGIKKTLLISVLGSLIVQIILQITLNPWVIYLLLLTEGVLLGLFWPVLMTNISIISNSKALCENDTLKDKLSKNYNVAWNLGAIFSYAVGILVLSLIDNVIIMFRITLLYALIIILFTIRFQEPEEREEGTIINKVIPSERFKQSCTQENLDFPLFIPLLLIGFYGFLIGSVILLYPIKSEQLGYPISTIYLFNFFRMVAQTISISKTSGLSIRFSKKLLIVSLILLFFCFLMFGLNQDLFMFGFLFFVLGMFGALLFSFSFKLTVYKNTLNNTSKYSSYFETCFGLGFFLAPIISGLIADVSVNLSFYFLASLCFISFFVYLSIINKIKT